MLRAIIFDFNGVILNDEPIHFRAMQEAVSNLGIVLSEKDYWDKYLPFDDNECLRAICRDHAVHLSQEQHSLLIRTKIESYARRIRDSLPLFPGVSPLIETAAMRYPLAVASGARREEIETTLKATALQRHFRVIVAAEDFNLGKPHPESFLLALKKLNEVLSDIPGSIRPEECLVIEDSVGGVAGARAAGMRCLAVSNSYPPEKLAAADKVVPSLERVTPEKLESLF
jgi:beta-phosphoglucomutase